MTCEISESYSNCCIRDLMMRAIKSFLLFGLILAVASCSKSPPTEGDARKVLENTNESVKSGVAQVKSFRKINGREFEVNGVRGYELEFEA